MEKITENMGFVMNLWAVNTAISKTIDLNLGAVHGIGLTEFMVLFHLNNAHKKTMRRIDLAKSIGLTASGVTRLVTPMVKIGLVQKELNPRDARVSSVKIAPAGGRVLKEASASFRSSSQELLQDIDHKKLVHALDVFKLLGRDIFVE